MDTISALMGYTQAKRNIQLDTVMPGVFVVERFHGREGVNECPIFEIDVLSGTKYINTRPLRGSPIRLRLGVDGGQRCWNGYVTRVALVGTNGGLNRYRITMEAALAFLRLRRNSLYFVGKDVLGISEQVFGDHPEVKFSADVKQSLRTFPLRGQFRELDYDFVLRQLSEEGLNFRVVHAQDASGDGTKPSGDHTVVIFDSQASQETGETINFRYHDAVDPDGAILQFSERHQMVPDRVVTSSWNPAQVVAVAGEADAVHDPDAPTLPSREIFDAQRAGRFDSLDQAQAYAQQRLDALQLPKHIFYGAGAYRPLDIDKIYTLDGYTSGQVRFVPLAIEHEAVNNLGAEIAQLFEQSELATGYYRNRFVAVPPGVPIVPPHRDRPVVHGVQTAFVVGIPDTKVTSNRDHQVKIQFVWQRGEAPLRGGLTDTASRSNPAGHAPGNHESGIWVRVAEQAAGPNYGHVYVPRIDTECIVGFEAGNIDHPVVLGQVYNADAKPPFAAGEGSSANHAATLTGIQTQTLDGQAGSRWVMDDSAGQLRHELLNSVGDSRLGLGYLIDQSGTMRGDFKGEGFHLATTGWTAMRAPSGLLSSSTAKEGGGSTQMDTALGVGLLTAATETARRLDGTATAAKAAGLTANQAQTDLLKAIDPQQDGKYSGQAHGLETTKPTSEQRSGGAPVERYAEPAIVFESPDHMTLTTPHSAVAFAADHVHITTQGDGHLAAGATLAGVSGDAVSLFSAEGGVKVTANQGPVSIQAHTDKMDVLADQSVEVISTAERVDVLAKDTIVIQQGRNRITLQGSNILIETPGAFVVKAQTHHFLGPLSASPDLAPLPLGTVGQYHELVAYKDTMQQAIDGRLRYKVVNKSDPTQELLGDAPPEGLTTRMYTQAEQPLGHILRFAKFKTES